MYSQIANTSFSYIMTLNKFRQALPEDHKSSWIKITTITMVSKFLDNIDIQKLRSRLTALGPIKLRMKGTDFEGFEWKLKDTTFYNQISLGYSDVYTNKSIKVFPNGSVQFAGGADLFDCNRIIRQLVYLIKTVLELDDDIPTDSFRIVMINSNFSLNYAVNLNAVVSHFNDNKLFKVSFKSERYSAVRVKFRPAEGMKQVTASIFNSGKIIVTGAEKLMELAYAYHVINSHINVMANKIKVARSETIDVFDTFMGYKIEDLVKSLEKKGFKPWSVIGSIYEINF